MNTISYQPPIPGEVTVEILSSSSSVIDTYSPQQPVNPPQEIVAPVWPPVEPEIFPIESEPKESPGRVTIKVASAEYCSESLDTVQVTYKDGYIVSTPWPSNVPHSVDLRHWVDDGNIIGAYVPPSEPKNDEIVDLRIRNDPVLNGMVSVFSNIMGVSSNEIIALIKSAIK